MNAASIEKSKRLQRVDDLLSTLTERRKQRQSEIATSGSKSAVERLVMRIWSKLPGGWMCRFWYGEQRITFRRNGWITIDAGRGTVKDMIPITFASQQLIDEIEKQLVGFGHE